MNTVHCGEQPVSLGKVNLIPREMMFFLYMPIKMPGTDIRIPERLRYIQPLLRKIMVFEPYVYLTVKTMYVTAESPGNRPGWHIDGFQSNGDINYIWYDANPTEFAIQEFVNIPDDDKMSMVDIEAQIKPDCIKTYPNRTLLRLDESVVHRVSPNPVACKRTFIKITTSEHQFRNEGNSHNYLFDYFWEPKPRDFERNLDHG